MHTRGAFSIARFDKQGNAKAHELWNERRHGSTFFFLCIAEPELLIAKPWGHRHFCFTANYNMGFISKVLNYFLLPSLEKGCIDQYVNFLESGNEFNTEVLDCNDADYCLEAIDGLQKYGAEISNNDLGYCYNLGVMFEGQIYNFFVFKHYARAINVGIAIETKETDLFKIWSFLNEINREDRLHQIGVVEENGKIFIRVFRQFLCTPNIGNSDLLAQMLRDLKDFANQLTILQDPGKEAWKKWASIKSNVEVETAADFWFNQDSSSCLHRFAKSSRVLLEEESFVLHSMIDIGSFGGVLDVGAIFLRKTYITTYPDFPYLTMMQVSFREGDPLIGSINEQAVLEFCIEWNAMLHFAPCKASYFHDDDGTIIPLLTMCGLYADDTNTRTYVDFLCSFQKAMGVMVHSLRADEG